MNRTAKIILFYTGVAGVAAGIIGISFWARSTMPSNQHPPEMVVDTGREVVKDWFPIEKDLSAVNQAGDAVKLSDLRGKVWIATEFFSVCPFCAVRNGSDLRAIYDEFKGNPDFHIACISVDPEADKPEKLKDYAKALGADSSNWWFLNGGDAATVHPYLEHEMKFFGIRERTDPLDIEANGRYKHDMGFILVDRNFHVVGKWPLGEARTDEAKKLDPGLYDRLKKDLFDRIRTELAKSQTSANP